MVDNKTSEYASPESPGWVEGFEMQFAELARPCSAVFTPQFTPSPCRLGTP